MSATSEEVHAPAAPRGPRRLELMSPAGHWPQLQAAIEAGADAVYFGLRHFSARAKVGFTLDEVPRAIETLHRRGVKAYVTFNTLIFDHELPQAASAIEAIANAGADAVIVQDVGMARWIHGAAPRLPLHGSTQMSITSAQGAELARQVGCCRVVLGRELSLRDLAQIAAETDVELEVFVHGALCVSYSGQCFSSEAWGGRSANRGQCAQACRLSYQMIVDGKPTDLAAARYLLSPGDLCALKQIPQLVDIGIACVKIEGRYKDADYVALVTQAYRQAIDAAQAGRSHVVTEDDWRELEQVYSRGLGPHFIAGTNHQRVVSGRAPRHRGVRVGRVAAIVGRRIEMVLEQPVYRGDGLVFDAADRRSPEIAEQGGFVFDVVSLDGRRAQVEFGVDAIDVRDIEPGDWVWRTHDPRLARRARQWTHAKTPVFRRPLRLRAEARVGTPLRITATTDENVSAEYVSEKPLVAARTNASSEELIRTQLARLGETPFYLDSLECLIDGQPFIPASLLNEARRRLVESILQARISRPQRATIVTLEDESHRMVNIQPAPLSQTAPGEQAAIRDDLMLDLLVRDESQLEAAIACAPTSITLDYLELFGLRDSVAKVRSAGLTVRVASPRILKPSEQNIVRFLLSLETPVVVRSGGLLWELTRPGRASRWPLIADFSLNAANRLTVESLLEMGVALVTPTHDLDARQIAQLAVGLPPDCLEVILYQHLPIFHTEHCVFCRFLSAGTDRSNCGQPCEKHRVTLRDGDQRQHPVLADVGCRNTVFNAPIQSGARHLATWRHAGIGRYRLEFVHQTASQVRSAVDSLRAHLGGRLSVDDLEREWSKTAPAGITEGSLFVPAHDRQLVQLNG